jgi:hypothetical protein
VTHTRGLRFVGVWLVAWGIQVGGAADVGAQSVPPRGEGTIALTYQNYYVTGHFDLLGRKNTNGGTHSKSVIAELDYAVTDTIGLTVSLPFIASKYTGSSSYIVRGFQTFPGPLDDGSYHSAFQDLHVEVRRAFLAGPVAVAPLVGASLPTHDYETVGEAVPGRRRRELQLGASFSALLDPVLPGTYVNFRYTYAAAEHVRGLPYTHSNLDLEGGHGVTSRVALRGVVSWQIAHKGPTTAELASDWINHDRLIASNYVSLGGGASVSLPRGTDLYALWVANVAGESGAHVARTLALGASWSFGGGFGGLGAAPSLRQRSNPTPGALLGHVARSRAR